MPRTWVLPPDAFRAFLRHAGLWELAREGRDAELRARILGAELPFALPAVAPRMAVRSSALDEDGRVHSHAGQYESVLNVQPEGLADAVLRCWASYHGERATAYRGGPGAPGGMAVLVQEMVDARVAGVLFTVNPLTGSWREMTAEAVWGLGETLVGGQVIPDRYVVRRPRRAAAWLLAGARLDLESEVVARQDRQVVPARTGGVEDAPADAPLARKLTRGEVLELCRLGLRAESLLDAPQDMEWAQDRAGRFWVLQSRRITSRAELPRGGATLWTRRFMGERWPEGATPLGWSILAPVLEHFIAYPATSVRFLGGEPPLRLVGGHPYVNVTVFRHLAFKAPGMPPPRFLLDFFPPDEEQQWLRRAAAPPDLRVYASILKETFEERRWRRFRWNPLTNWRAWEDFLARLGARLAVLEAAAPEAALAIGTEIVRDYVKIHITSLLFANIAYEIVAPKLTLREQERLLRPPAGSITTRVNGELWDLGRDPARLAAFLRDHGHRSSASWEVYSRRWAEDPEGVLRLAAMLAEGPDPRLRVEKGEIPSSRGVFLAQTYLRLREEQRYHLDRIFYVLKRQLRRLGARWFADPDDVRFLTASELAAGELDGSVPDLHRIVERRRAEIVDPAPPDFLRGDEALLASTRETHRFQGLGISPGIVRGRTRVLGSPDEGHRLLPGEILVARSTDPNWTPLFPRAAGLVLELGSMLSHGAVVAREYRVPGVVNIAGATRLFPDGTEITLDGRGGGVWVHAT